MTMSVIDSRRYGRPNMTNLTRAEFERIKNTPPSDLTELREESERVRRRMLEAQELRIAEEREDASTAE